MNDFTNWKNVMIMSVKRSFSYFSYYIGFCLFFVFLARTFLPKGSRTSALREWEGEEKKRKEKSLIFFFPFLFLFFSFLFIFLSAVGMISTIFSPWKMAFLLVSC